MTTGLMKNDGNVLFDDDTLCVTESELFMNAYTWMRHTSITITKKNKLNIGGTGVCLLFDLWLSKYNPKSELSVCVRVCVCHCTEKSVRPVSEL